MCATAIKTREKCIEWDFLYKISAKQCKIGTLPSVSFEQILLDPLLIESWRPGQNILKGESIKSILFLSKRSMKMQAAIASCSGGRRIFFPDLYSLR